MSGSVGLGLGSGFAQGLSKVLLSHRQEQDKIAAEQDQRQANLKLQLLPYVLQHAASYDDVQPFIEDIIGKQPKGGKNSGPDAHSILAAHLNPILADNNAKGSGSGINLAPPTEGQQAADAASNAKASATGELPTSAAVSPTTPAPKRERLMGVPMLSDEEIAAKNENISTSAMTAKLQAQANIARKILPELQKADPTITLRDALEYVGKGGVLPTRTFTPGALVKGVSAENVPDGALDNAGNPIDKTKSPYWDLIRGQDGKSYYTPGAAPAGAFKPVTGALGERFRVLLAKDGLDEQKVERSPEIQQKYLQMAGQQLDAEGKSDRATKDALATSLEASRKLSEQMERERLGNLPSVDDLQANAKTINIGGKQYHFVSSAEFAGNDAKNAATKAGQKAGVLVVSPAEADQLKAAQGAFSNLDTMLGQIKAKLPADAQGRPLTGLANKLSDIFQTDDDIAAFRSWNLETFQLLSSLKDTGRISNNAFQEGLKDRPLISDTVGTAAKKVDNLKSMIGSTVNPILQRGMTTFSTTYQDKTYSFDTQAKLNAFKRQYPDAK